MMQFVIILGIIAFLLMEHTVVFWFVFVPLAIIFVAFSLKWLKSGGMGLSDYVTAALAFIFMIVSLIIVCIP